MCLSFALANGKQTVTGVGPAKAGDFYRLANYFRAKWADDRLFNHSKQTRVLFIFAEAIYRSFVDQFFQLRWRGLLVLRSCHLVIIRCGWRFVIGDPVVAAPTFNVRVQINLADTIFATARR